MILLGKTEFNGVEFNDVLKGGIAMPDPAARKAWQNVSIGKGNLGSEDELFTKYTGSMDIKMKDTGIAKGMAEKDKETE